MATKTSLITGANGQLGKEFRALENSHPDFRFVFADRSDLPLDDIKKIVRFVESLNPDYCVNCAAYTAVDKAETDSAQAFLVNGEAVGILAAVCAKLNCKLIHLSTDYVFDGNAPTPYPEDALTNPVNLYGASKLKGEQLCMANNADSIIIRTAWVFSAFGNNFVKTMMRLMKERQTINVVNDQIGAPTYAADLAIAILTICNSGNWVPGIYHYSNKGRISWFEFATAIRETIQSTCVVNGIPSSEYPTPAKRPSFSLLNTTKIRNTYGIEIPQWQDSLHDCLSILKQL
ncbi:MAG: dTDP-4-dehydrorhamnose reductase [Chitinophagaceae bacterium]|nr:dTDP-4-dehydrorhamnose reductase [Chitinophagaceae bacterium]